MILFPPLLLSLLSRPPFRFSFYLSQRALIALVLFFRYSPPRRRPRPSRRKRPASLDLCPCPSRAESFTLHPLRSPVLLGPRRSFSAVASSLSVPPTAAVRGSWRPRGALPRRACATPRAFYADADADAAAVARSRRSLGPGVSRSGTGKQLRGNREAAKAPGACSRALDAVLVVVAVFVVAVINREASRFPPENGARCSPCRGEKSSTGHAFVGVKNKRGLVRRGTRGRIEAGGTRSRAGQRDLKRAEGRKGESKRDTGNSCARVSRSRGKGERRERERERGSEAASRGRRGWAGEVERGAERPEGEEIERECEREGERDRQRAKAVLRATREHQRGPKVES